MIAIIAALALIAPASPSPAPVGPAPLGSPPAVTLTGEQIYDKTRMLLRAMHYEPFVTYTVTVTSNTNFGRFEETYQSYVSTVDDNVITSNAPLRSTNRPESPYGFNITIFGAVINHREQVEEPFGLPFISPLYTFGLRDPRQVSLFGQQPLPDSGGPPVIGRITTVGRDYKATLLGVEPMGAGHADHYAYHLRLEPLEDPGRYRLRDLWVETKTMLVCRLRSEGVFATGPATSATWYADFHLVDGHYVMTREWSDASFTVGGSLFGFGATRYDGVSYELSFFKFGKLRPEFFSFRQYVSQAVQR